MKQNIFITCLRAITLFVASSSIAQETGTIEFDDETYTETSNKTCKVPKEGTMFVDISEGTLFVDSWDKSGWLSKWKILGAGDMNGGGGLIQITTSGSNVIIKKRWTTKGFKSKGSSIG